jgi:hypothetical protein
MATLKFTAPLDSLGNPERNLALYGIPARDVEESELTQEQVALALDSGLYERKGGDPPEQPVWYRLLVEEAAKAGATVPELAPRETRKQFRERTGYADVNDGDESADETADTGPEE